MMDSVDQRSDFTEYNEIMDCVDQRSDSINNNSIDCNVQPDLDLHSFMSIVFFFFVCVNGTPPNAMLVNDSYSFDYQQFNFCKIKINGDHVIFTGKY